MLRWVALAVVAVAEQPEPGKGDAQSYGYEELWSLLSSHKSTFKVLPGLQALATTNVCWSKSEALFRTDDEKDMCKALPDYVWFLEERPEATLKRGMVWPSANETYRLRMKRRVHKTFTGYSDLQYCWNIRSKSWVDTKNFTRVGGLTVLLTEHHGNVNIGHASRDASFLASLLRHGGALPPLRQLIVKDHQYHHVVRQGRRVMRYRVDSLAALTAGRLPPGGTAFLGDPEADAALERLQGAGAGVCFDLALQRLRDWYFDHGVYRRAAWGFCGVPESQPLDTILLEEHDNTRRWHDRDGLAEFIAAHKIARGFRVLLASFSKASFCDQVRVLARSKVAIMHHGAGLVNCAFLAPESVCIEVDGACPGGESKCLPPVSTTLFQQFFTLIGTRYVGARAVIPVRRGSGTCPMDSRYYYEPDCTLKVKYEAFTQALDTAIEVGAPWPEANWSLGVVDHLSLWPVGYMQLQPVTGTPLQRTSADGWATTSAAPVAAVAPQRLPNAAGGSSKWEVDPRSAVANSLGSWNELLLVPALSCVGQLVVALWWVCQRLRSCGARRT